MIEDRRMVCDGCQKIITRILSVPPEGWPKMHNLCSACFIDLSKRSISTA